MTSRSTANEVRVPSILADFEPGDKVYCRYKNFLTHFGGVISVEDDSMMVYIWTLGDEPQKIRGLGVPVDDEDIFHISRWRKMPDAAELKKGDVLSTTLPYYVLSFGSREYFTVAEVVPGRKVVLHARDNSGRVITLTEIGSLDAYLQYWELEP